MSTNSIQTLKIFRNKYQTVSTTLNVPFGTLIYNTDLCFVGFAIKAASDIKLEMSNNRMTKSFAFKSVSSSVPSHA